MPPHLVITLTAHGFGHAAQTSPIINQLRTLRPNIRITLRSTLPEPFLLRHFQNSCELRHEATDFGMEMSSAIDVLADASAVRYEALHKNWKQRVASEASTLAKLKPDLVLSNISYLTLAGASLLEVPSIALSSLNWADIYQSYCGKRPEAGNIIDQMRDAYNSALCFVKITPSLPMNWLKQCKTIGPIARLGQNQRSTINKQLNLNASDTLVLVALGGITTRIPIERWPHLPGVVWLIPQQWDISRVDMRPIEKLKLPFTDILRSSTLVLTKPGYGTFAEAACNAVPVLSVKRSDWPEEPFLVDWLRRHGRVLLVDRDVLEHGEFSGLIDAVQSLPLPVEIAQPTGTEQAAQYLAKFL